jgi:ParB family chromosome partitioning protein
MKSRGLGKGLRALIPEVISPAEGDIVEIPVGLIEPAPFQARREFDDEALAELAASISEYGVMQPVVLRPLGGERYQLIIGERRWRASQRAGLERIPALVRDVDDLTSSEMMLVENLQREDLNPLEEANAYKRLSEEFQLTQEEIARRVGKSRSFIANSLRILQLPADVLGFLNRGLLSAGHAKVLLGLDDAGRQSALAHQVVTRKLSVRDTEKDAARLMKAAASRPARSGKADRDAEFDSLEEQLRQILGTRVRISAGRRGGKIEIDYYSKDELDRLLEWFLGDLSR